MDAVIIVCAVMAFMLLAVAAGSFYFYNVAVGRNKKRFLRGSRDLKQTFETADCPPDQENVPCGSWLESRSCEARSVVSEDGLKLYAYYVPADKPSLNTAILAHGYSEDGKSMEAFARLFNSLGFNVILPDARGHGQSEGHYIGFGWHERKDYLLWIQNVIDSSGEGAKIVLMGISMGAATVMAASGEALPPQVKAIIEDCGYSSLWEQLSWQLKRFFRLPAFPFMYTTSLITKLLAGYGFKEVSPIEQVKKSVTPTLFIHGGDDSFVPFRMAYELYGACPSKKDIMIAPGAGHGMAYSADAEAYERKIKEFVERFI